MTTQTQTASTTPRRAKVMTARDGRRVALWKAAEYVGLVAFVAMVPRAMGPEQYAQLATIISFLALAMLGTALGGASVLGRFVPGYLHDGREDMVRTLYSQYFWARAALATPMAAVFYVAARRLLPELPVHCVLVATGSMILMVLSRSGIELAYGLNKVNLWMGRDSAQRLLLVLALLVLGLLADPVAAIYTLAAIELGFFLLVGSLSWRYLSFGAEVWNRQTLHAHFGFGALLFFANLMLGASWRAGESLILEFTGDRAAVSNYSLSSAVVLAFTTGFAQVGAALVPSLTSIYLSGESEKVEGWLGMSLKYLTIAATGVYLTIAGVGEAVISVAVGGKFVNIIEHLNVLMLTFFPMNVVRTSQVVLILRKEPRRGIYLGVSAFLAFVATVAALLPTLGGLAISIALVVSVTAAAITAYWQFQLGGILARSKMWLTCGVGVLCWLPIRAFPQHPWLATTAALVAFLVCVFVLRIATKEELSALLRRRGRAV